MKILNVGKSLSFSFNVIKNNPIIILITTLVVIVFRLFFYIIYQQYYHFSGSNIANIIRTWKTVPVSDLILFEIIIPFVFITLTSIILILFYKIGIQAYEKKKVSLKEIPLPSFIHMIKYLLLVIVFTVLQYFCFLLLIVPGFIFSCTYLWVFIIFVDNHSVSIKELFKKSAELSAGIRWSIFGCFLLYFIALQGINFILKYLFDSFFQSGNILINQGIQLIILVLIFTPILTLSYSFLYKDLKEQQDKVVPSP